MSASHEPEVDLFELALVLDALELLSKLAIRCAPMGYPGDEHFVSMVTQVEGIVEQLRGRNGIDETTEFTS